MEPVALVVDKLRGFAKSTQDFTNEMLHSFGFSGRRNPIEILKRLQREAFSDIMKLRDRQDKVERLLSLKSSKVSPFEESGTRVRGEVQVLGLLLMVDRIHDENQDAIRRIGFETGVTCRFSFQTVVGQSDSLKTEFVARDNGKLDGFGSPLSLAKVVYAANVNDWCSLIAVPLGGRCSDVGPSGSSRQEHSLSGPPLLNQHIGHGIALTVRKPNIIASFAQFVSLLDSQATTHCLSTFGQVIYQLSTTTKLALLGLHQTPKFTNQHVSLGPMALPLGVFRRHAVHTGAPNGSLGSTALMLESELDSSTRIEGWVEMNNSNARNLRWGLLMSDSPGDDIGWGLRVSGSVRGPEKWGRFRADVFSKVKIGEKFWVEPTLVYVMDGSTRFPAFMVRSSWSF